MSDTDSFIEEVTEEVKRDRLFALLKRYGWIAALAILGIVGGAALTEYRKAQVQAEAEGLGDAMLAALEIDEPQARATALAGITAGGPQARAVLQFLTAAEQIEAGARADAVATLNTVATNGEIPEIYRQLASFKALALQADTMDAASRRQAFEGLALPGSPFRLMAQEQLALVDISAGNAKAGIDAYQAILNDAEVSTGLQQRALQAIVALGGTPDVANLPDNAGTAARE